MKSRTSICEEGLWTLSFSTGKFVENMDAVIYKAKKFTLVKRARKVGDRIVWGEYLVHPGAVAVLALREGKIILVRQFRPALSQWTLEIPAGTLEGEESPEEAAAREMVEETGYMPQKLVHLVDFYPTPGVSNELIKIYYTHDLKYVGISNRDPGEEDMQIVEVSPGEAMAMVDRGEIRDSKTIIALLYATRRGFF